MKRDDILDVLYFGYPLREGERYWQNVCMDKGASHDVYSLKSGFLSSLERLLGKKKEVILPLSGGLDSRFVLACLLELLPAKNIYAFNYGTQGQLDFEIPPFIASKNRHPV